MLFNSYTFLLFFGFVFGLFRAVPGWKAKKSVLLVASYLFYAAWSPPYVLLLLLSTVVDWLLARQIGRSNVQRTRFLWLLLSLACNLGMVAYFKYGNFLLENWVAMMHAVGIAYQPLRADIVLPIGISFYTFASLSYTVDVYRRELDGKTGLADYALFVSYFPHLVAGPIVRASYLLPQIAQERRATSNQIAWGVSLTIIGLASKVVMADAILMPVVDRFYAAPEKWSMPDAWIAVLSFAGQIYYDFSGYSLCAIGLALCFGFAFPDNFRHPYGARGFSDFWRRWHISLSSWLRDYLYIPLGGNRHGAARTYLALMLTMLAGGLWHGASWMFVLWGGLHGAYLVLESSLRKPKLALDSMRAYGWYDLLTFAVVTLTWIPFRAPTSTSALNVLESLSGVSRLANPDLPAMIALVAMLLTVRLRVALRDSSLESLLAKAGVAGQVLVLSTCLIGLYLCSGGDQHAFIYFQF